MVVQVQVKEKEMQRLMTTGLLKQKQKVMVIQRELEKVMHLDLLMLMEMDFLIQMCLAK